MQRKKYIGCFSPENKPSIVSDDSWIVSKMTVERSTKQASIYDIRSRSVSYGLQTSFMIEHYRNTRVKAEKWKMEVEDKDVE